MRVQTTLLYSAVRELEVIMATDKFDTAKARTPKGAKEAKEMSKFMVRADEVRVRVLWTHVVPWLPDSGAAAPSQPREGCGGDADGCERSRAAFARGNGEPRGAYAGVHGTTNAEHRCRRRGQGEVLRRSSGGFFACLITDVSPKTCPRSRRVTAVGGFVRKSYPPSLTPACPNRCRAW
jgi:hypothetical protein